MWTVTLRPGEMGGGGRRGYKERDKRRRRVKNGGAIGDRSGERGK